MKPRLWPARAGVLAALIGMAAISACGGANPAADAPGSTQQLTKVKVASLSAAADAPLYAAIEEGYFDDVGLEVELVPVKASSDVPALLASGQVDFGTGQPNATFFNAAAAGIKDPVVLATNVYGPDTSVPALLVRKDLADSGQVTGAGDLDGETVAVVGPSTSSQYFAESAIRAAGGDPGTVEFTVMGLPDMLSALSNGKIAGAWMFEPLASTAISGDIAVAVAGVGEVAEGFPTWLQASEKIVSADPAAVQAFVEASLRALGFYEKALVEGRRADIVGILTKYTNMTEASDWADVELPTVSSDGSFDAEAVVAFQQYLVDGGVVDRVTPVPEYLNDSFRQSVLDAG
ncbi:ABC transporter substrate-binding protein [Arthrobacter sp. zg-Y1219]|uniref:ABC transporter substrate-binding protein n=1 Tax=Arthrobacter sp. zg-Y1219 TaxID=3049067 RepID=UPI0024C28071|nr:ABC transporter substrate-binding protein [Arthrobacter sp. zg-Y1219]MDK1361697.1 ABC transporter substrate-binding protein [Arthrobacter sp. zg-Y1219]